MGLGNKSGFPGGLVGASVARQHVSGWGNEFREPAAVFVGGHRIAAECVCRAIDIAGAGAGSPGGESALGSFSRLFAAALLAPDLTGGASAALHRTSVCRGQVCAIFRFRYRAVRGDMQYRRRITSEVGTLFRGSGATAERQYTDPLGGVSAQEFLFLRSDPAQSAECAALPGAATDPGRHLRAGIFPRSAVAFAAAQRQSAFRMDWIHVVEGAATAVPD